MPVINSRCVLPARAKDRQARNLPRGEIAPKTLLGRLDEVVEGRISVSYTSDGIVKKCPARSTVAVDLADVGKEVVLTFASDAIEDPIILGMLQPPPGPSPIRAKLDGDRLVLTAAREIVLECGEASITLTRAGKVLIRGTYVLSRSEGVNRIRGGSVQIN